MFANRKYSQEEGSSTPQPSRSSGELQKAFFDSFPHLQTEYWQIANDLSRYGLVPKIEQYGSTHILLFWSQQHARIVSLGDSQNFAECIGCVFQQDQEADDKFFARKKRVEQKYSRNLPATDPLQQNLREVSFLPYSAENWTTLVGSIKQRRQLAERPLGSTIQEKQELQKTISLAVRVLNSKLSTVSAVCHPLVPLSSQELNPFGPEAVFVHKNQRESLQITPMTVLGYTFSGIKNGTPPENLEMVDAVCGFVIVADSASVSERKQAAKLARQRLGTLYPLDPTAVVLAVDHRLVARWRSMPVESCIAPSAITTEQILKRPSFEILRPTQVEKISVQIREPKTSHIGGTQITYVVHSRSASGKKVITQIPLDRGWIFDLVPQWNGIGTAPSYAQGIAPYLEKGMWGMDAGMYRLDLLLRSLTPAVLESLRNCQASSTYMNHHEFIGLELYARLGKEGLEHALRTTDATRSLYQQLKKPPGKLSERAFWEPIARKSQELYGKQERVTPLAVLSHAHQDHSLGFSLLDDNIVRGFSAITHALATSDFYSSGAWAVQEVAARRMREQPKVGAAYHVLEYPHLILQPDGVRREVAPHIYLSAFPVEHSIPGAVAVKLEYGLQKGIWRSTQYVGSVVYPGDYRTPETFDAVAKSGKTDLLFVEGTNPPVPTNKDSVRHTETSVRHKFAQIFAEVANKKELVVVDMVKNNFERLNAVIQEAVAQGRTVVLSPKIAIKCQRMRLFQSVLTQEQRLQVPDLSEDCYRIWRRPMQVYATHERALFAEYGPVGQDELSANPQEYVLIREGHESMEHLGGISAPTTWIRSVYGDYDRQAVQYTQACKEFAGQRGWKLLRESFHATGHAPLYPATDPRSKGGILEAISRVGADVVVPIHTEHRYAVVKALQSYNMKGKIVERISHEKLQELTVYQK